MEDSLGTDIKIIREILFGEHLKSIREEIAIIREEIERLKNQDRALETGLQNEHGRSQAEAQRLEAEAQRQGQELDSRLQALDQRLVGQIAAENRERQTNQTETNERVEASFAQLRSEIDARFAEHHTLHQDLISSLAAALLKFRDQSASEALQPPVVHD